MELYFHIGPGRTGSSFIQTVLAENREALQGLGIAYDDTLSPRMPDAPGKGAVKGNGAIWRDVVENRDIAKMETLLAGMDGNNVVSSEALVMTLARGDSFDWLCEQLFARDVTRLHILTYTRDPLDGAISMFSQRSKYKLDGLKIDDYLLEKSNSVVVLRDFLKRAYSRDDEKVRVVFHNYSRVKNRLMSVVAEWLQIQEDDLSLSDFIREAGVSLNRSLSRTELAILETLAELDVHPAHFSRAVVQELPDRQNDILLPSLKAVEAFRHKIAPVLREVEAISGQPDLYSTEDSLIERIRENERLRQLEDTTQFVLDRAQLDAIVRAIVKAKAKNRNDKPSATASKHRTKPAEGAPSDIILNGTNGHAGHALSDVVRQLTRNLGHARMSGFIGDEDYKAMFSALQKDVLAKFQGPST